VIETLALKIATGTKSVAPFDQSEGLTKPMNQLAIIPAR
jgi:hypothetical protein